MGGTSSKLKNSPIPNPKDPALNRCSDSLGDTLGREDIRLCFSYESNTLSNEYNQVNASKEFCQSIGAGKEWTYKDTTGSCCTKKNSKFFFGRGFEQEGLGCLFSGEEGALELASGKYTECERTSFVADPLTCCFLDHDCFTRPEDSIPDSCFETKNRLKTCSPEYRNMSSTQCLDLIKPYCMGSELLPGQANWWDMWVSESGVELKPDIENYDFGPSRFNPDDLKFNPDDESRYVVQPCMRALARAMTRDDQFCTWESIQELDIRRGNYDQEGLRWSQEVVTAIFDRYINQFGSFIGGINTKGQQNRKMENVFFEICTKFPVLCQDSMYRICENINATDLSDTSRADIWCGCYMPDNEYQKYVDNYQIGKECTPFCNNPATIPLVDEDGYEKICRHDICIIDDLRLNFVRTKNQGDGNKVTFTQLCGGCGGINIDRKITGVQDFNTERNLILGLYSQTIKDKIICRNLSIDSPFQNLFPNNEPEITLVMKSVDTGNEILVTLAQTSSPVGSGTGSNVISEWGLVFKNSSSLNEDYLFKNGEEMEFANPNYTLSCKLYAITVVVQYGSPNTRYENGDITIDISTRYLFRSRETYGNQCTCIIEDSSINIVDSKFGNLNLYQNCGSNYCTDENNNEIPCTSVDIEKNENYYSPEAAINITKNDAKQRSVNITAYIIFGLFILFALIAIGVGFSNR